MKITFSSSKWIFFLIRQGFLVIIGILSVTILYFLSEKKSQYNNAFIRKYIPHFAEKKSVYQLNSNGYYIAGFDSCYIYLSHPNAPLYLKTYDYHTGSVSKIQLKIEHENLPYRRLKIHVDSPNFYIGDGSLAIIQKGEIHQSIGKTITKDLAYFNHFTIGKNENFGIQASNKTNHYNLLGLLQKKANKYNLHLNHTSLTNQINGTFDTDGQLIWNKQNNEYLYMYYYRNNIIILDSIMTEKYQFTSIDTISKAQLDISYYPKQNQYKLGPNSIRVNQFSDTYNQYLYIHSNRIGKFEKQTASTSIIDVYDYKSKNYHHSFYLEHLPNHKLKNFKIYKNSIAVILNNDLYLYKMKN